jgi:hypothetical protein
MSTALWAVAAAAATAAAPAPAITAEEALENARAVYSVETRRRARRCPEPKPGEILVCREREDPDELRVPSDTDLGDPNDGMVRAPNVSSLPDWRQGARFGRKPPDPLIIDLNSIPEAPPGSDADRIAKGEMAAP